MLDLVICRKQSVVDEARLFKSPNHKSINLQILRDRLTVGRQTLNL
jgi:hypothetical protein